jgi:hypothetical protein
MTYKLTIDQKPGYLHAVVTGWNSRENVVRYMEELIRECTARNFFRVLIEERLEGPRLGTLDVYEMVSEGSSRFRGMAEGDGLRRRQCQGRSDAVCGERGGKPRVPRSRLFDRGRRRAMAASQGSRNRRTTGCGGRGQVASVRKNVHDGSWAAEGGSLDLHVLAAVCRMG